ncbi:MAG: hypothetical protein EOO69_12660 [Moraxellaceae bacterium]|nr:MAG: hypothetical protein EOO69_12660 [Moraxellaceae bacterium]
MATSRIEKTPLQKIGLHQNRKIVLNKPDLRIGLVLIIVITSVLIWLVFYCTSPYWYSRAMVQQLSQNNLAVAEQAIPASLLQPYKADLLATRQLSAQQQQQPGAKYLQQVWPKVAEQQNLYQLLLLHFNSAPSDSIQSSYSRFPSRFRLTVGNTPQNTLWLEWQRASWNRWTLSKLCVYNPQPVAEVNNCRSSSR